MRKGVFIVLSAMIFVSTFNFSTSVLAEDKEYIASRSFSGIKDNKIEIAKKSTITYLQDTTVELDAFKKSKEVVFVMDSSAVVDTTVETKKPFDYALFSGDDDKDMELKGSDMTINGDVHSNRGIFLSSSDIKIAGESIDKSTGKSTDEGIIEAVTKVNVEGTIASDSKYQINNGVGKIDMHDYSDYFIGASQKSGTYFSTDIDPVTGKPYWAAALKDMNGLFINDKDFKKNLSEYLSCQYIESENMWQINGQTLVLHKERPLFFDGNVRVSNQSIEGSGFIVATGNVIFNTMKFDGDGKMADIGIYAIGEKDSDTDKTGEVGNITFALGSTQFKGLLYAPKGEVNLQTSNTKINGSVVAEKIVALNGGLSITHVSTEAHQTIEIPHKTDTHLSVVKGAVGNFIKTTLKDQDLKVGVLAYKNTANAIENNNVFELFDMKDNDKVDALGDVVNSIEAGEDNAANLGDGLRRAYHLLKNKGDKNADKYVIVLSCANPDKWTKGTLGEKYMLGDGEAPTPDTASEVEEGYIYANEVLEQIKADGDSSYKTYFVDFKFNAELSKIKELGGTNFYNPNASNQDDFPKEIAATLSDIGQSIREEVNYLDVKATAEFVDLFPTGVGYVKPATPVFDATINTAGTANKDDDREEIKKEYTSDKIDLNVVDGKLQVKVKDDAFEPAEVKFSTLGAKLFDGGEIKFKFTDLDGNPLAEKSGKISPNTINVVLTVDIN